MSKYGFEKAFKYFSCWKKRVLALRESREYNKKKPLGRRLIRGLGVGNTQKDMG